MIIRTAAVAAPERVGWLATEAQTAARPVRFSFLRNNPLAGIAEAVAAADPKRAVATARSIEDTFSRSGALVRIAQVVAAT